MHGCVSRVYTLEDTRVLHSISSGSARVHTRVSTMEYSGTYPSMAKTSRFSTRGTPEYTQVYPTKHTLD